MYGFGDDVNPRQDTVELVEDLMIEYIETIVMAHDNNMFYLNHLFSLPISSLFSSTMLIEFHYSTAVK